MRFPFLESGPSKERQNKIGELKVLAQEIANCYEVKFIHKNRVIDDYRLYLGWLSLNQRQLEILEDAEIGREAFENTCRDFISRAQFFKKRVIDSSKKKL